MLYYQFLYFIKPIKNFQEKNFYNETLVCKRDESRGVCVIAW